MGIRPIASKRILAKAVFLALSTMLCAGFVAAQDSQKSKKVLILFTHQSDQPGQVIVEKAMRSTLESGSSVPVEIYAEYLDAVRMPLDGHEKELVAQLQRKYSNKNFDLIYAVNPPALKLLLENRSAFFPDTPIVYLVLNQQNVNGLDSSTNMTGVWGEVSDKSNVELALALHPGTKRVVVISGVGEWDNYWRAHVQEELRALEGRIEVSYLTGLTVSELQKTLAALPSQSLVLFVSSTLDHEGNSPGNLAVLREICPASSAPVYGNSDAQLGLGIVGGDLLSFEALGAEGARVGLRVMAGEKPEAIAPHGIPNVPMFDWRELQRWGVREASLPEGSVVQFKQPTVWEEYKWYAIGLVVAVIVETLLIAWLLYLRLRRRQAESEAARVGDRLAEIVANVPGIVWESRTDRATNRRTTTFISDYVYRMLGYTSDEWLQEPPGFGLKLVPEEERERVQRESDAVVETGKESVSEFRWVTKDGRVRWVENYIAPIVEGGKSIVGLRGVALDVTERYAAQQAVREREARLTETLEQLQERETRLTETLDQLQLSASAANVGMWTRKIGDDKIWVSEKAGEIWGFPRGAEITRQTFFQNVHPADRELFFKNVRELDEGKNEFHLEYRVLLPDGNFRWIHSRGKVEAVNGERFIRGAIVDVTKLKTAEEAIHNLSSKLMNAQEKERARLARELHDDLSQSIALLSIQLTTLSNDPKDLQHVKDMLDRYVSDIEGLAGDVHRISHELHPAKLTQLGLEAALGGFCRELAAAHPLEIEFEAIDVPRDLPQDISLCLYRVAQESLRNVVKHSGADLARVGIRSGNGEVRLSVSDNGNGFDTSATTAKEALGLISIDERVRAVKGEVKVTSAVGSGTKIEVRVPVTL